MMEMTLLKQDYFPDVAALFIQNFMKLRASVSILPDSLENVDHVCARLDRLSGGLVALDGGRVVGYLGWFLVDEFRGTERRGAYCPEWGHSAAPALYRELYGLASAQWFEAGCGVHAITLLAHDHEAEKVWFWSGFGLTVVDAIRSTDALENVTPVSVRKAALDDLAALTALEAEHAHYYRQPPILMLVYEAQNEAALAQFLGQPGNSIWLALNGADPIGYMRFDPHNQDSTAVVKSPKTVSNIGDAE